MAQRGGRRTGAGRKPGDPGIRAAVQAVAQGEAEVFTARRVLEEIAAVAFLDVAELYKADGTLKPLNEMPEHARRAIAGLKTSKYNEPGKRDGVQEDVLDVRLWSKPDALKMAAQFHALLVDVKADGGKVDDKHLRARIKQARVRVAAAARRKG